MHFFTERRHLFLQGRQNPEQNVKSVASFAESFQNREVEELSRQIRHQIIPATPEYRAYWEKQEEDLRAGAIDPVEVRDKIKVYVEEGQNLLEQQRQQIDTMVREGVITRRFGQVLYEHVKNLFNTPSKGSRRSKLEVPRKGLQALKETAKMNKTIVQLGTDLTKFKNMKLSGGKYVQTLSIFSEKDLEPSLVLTKKIPLLLDGNFPIGEDPKEFLDQLRKEKTRLLKLLQKRDDLLSRGQAQRDELVDAYKGEDWVPSLQTFFGVRKVLTTLVRMARGQGGLEEYFVRLLKTAHSDWITAGKAAENTARTLRTQLTEEADWAESKEEHEQFLQALIDVAATDPGALTPGLRKEMKLYQQNIKTCMLGLKAEDFSRQMEHEFHTLESLERQDPQKALLVCTELERTCSSYDQTHTGSGADVKNEYAEIWQLIQEKKQELEENAQDKESTMELSTTEIDSIVFREGSEKMSEWMVPWLLLIYSHRDIEKDKAAALQRTSTVAEAEEHHAELLRRREQELLLKEQGSQNSTVTALPSNWSPDAITATDNNDAAQDFSTSTYTANASEEDSSGLVETWTLSTILGEDVRAKTEAQAGLEHVQEWARGEKPVRFEVADVGGSVLHIGDMRTKMHAEMVRSLDLAKSGIDARAAESSVTRILHTTRHGSPTLSRILDYLRALKDGRTRELDVGDFV